MINATLRLALVAALAGSCALASLTPANAITLTWNFTSSNPNSSPGTTDSFASSPGSYTITASGFDGTAAWNPVSLYIKNTGSGENGLGLTNDPLGQNEITGTSFIQIDVTQALPYANTFTFFMGSTDNLEEWSVYGSNGTGTSATLIPLLSSTGALDIGTHTVSGYSYYDFFYNNTLCPGGGCSGQGNNVLLGNIFLGEFVSTGFGAPLPAAFPLFATGLGMLGLLGWRRKRKNAAAIAAA